ncbi:MAG TPA: family 20 glycosylhydrolase [Phnomibacter sp.]|nr:family 20 glycosylhydrolase [Phnomibacter sp.]
MKKFLVLFNLIFTSCQIMAQVKLPAFHDSLFSTYYHQRVSHFRLMPVKEKEVIFLGNSITDGAEWAQLFNDAGMVNQGISGDITAGVLHRIHAVTERKPAKVFLLIGTNDLARGMTADSVLKNMLLIADHLKEKSPTTRLFVQSILPVNDVYGKFGGHTRNTGTIIQLNEQLKAHAKDHHYEYIDLFTAFAERDGKLNPGLSNDGLHLMGNAYQLWKHIILPYVYDVQSKASLIPLPQQLKWNDGYFALYKCKTIVVKEASLRPQAEQLQQYLMKMGWAVQLSDKPNPGQLFIELTIGKVNAPLYESEAYQLNADPTAIRLTANTPHGIFNGIQTLKQLMRDGAMVDACSITDWPAFAWRGYMIDVGRNYVSMPLLKQQIDKMAAHKLNVFHFHPTEDIAWRIAIKQYPGLTAPEHMLRNKGMYYTEREIKELIQYCKDRFITFVPEIDMPGHSAAFKRAMKTDMQSDTGLAIVKNILREFCATYDVPYIHIGADEVKITNKAFIPEVTALIESLGKKVIGWQPGGNFSNSTIRQLWMDDNAHLSEENKIRSIDSRHLYINHMDPLESVVTLFNRQLCDKDNGDAFALGATLCLWHDRAVASEKDLMMMNPVYPGLLAFAERSWRGGGKKGWVANIDDGDVTAFNDFEARLLDHKKLSFKEYPFPYVKQSDMQWDLFGPFDLKPNEKAGYPNKKLLEEKRSAKGHQQVMGGTAVLRHWWAPLIKGALKDPAENTYYYATTNIWSEVDEAREFWIGFNDLSRSPATDSPPADAWDTKGSKVWVNGNEITPPAWARAGQQGNPEIPLIDEGYSYRSPKKIQLKKGDNEIVLKLPVQGFKGKNWQNPVKWMFTFVPIPSE